MLLALLPLTAAISIDRASNLLDMSNICGDPPVISNATSFIADRYAKTLKYTCDEGFILPDKGTSFNVTCSNSTSTYIGLATCSPATCDASQPIENSARVAPAAKLRYGQTLIQKCNRGYTGDGLVNGPGSLEFVCASDGLVTPVHEGLDSCIEITCGPPPLLPSAHTTLGSDISTRSSPIWRQRRSTPQSAGRSSRLPWH